MNNPHLISHRACLLDALKQINTLGRSPLVLFVLDDDNRMVGTLTDGDSRRWLTEKGGSLDSTLDQVMHRNFRFVRQSSNNQLEQIIAYREEMMKLVPVLDDDNHVVDIVNFDTMQSMLPIDAVLMAGGKGVRLRPLTETTPKPLLPVGGKAIIDHNIDRLMQCGVKHISVTVNYLAEQLEAHFAEPRGDVQVECIHEPKFLGTIGAVQFVPKFYNDVVLVMNSDLFTNIDYEDFYLNFLRSGAAMSAAAVPYTISVPYGIFDIHGDSDIVGIKEKPVYNYFANAGLYLIKREVLDAIPRDEFFNATDLIEQLINEGRKVVRYPITGYWLDIGSKEEYAKANELVKHIRR